MKEEVATPGVENQGKFETGGLKMVPATNVKTIAAPEQVDEKVAEAKGVMDFRPEDVKAMLAAGQLREEAIRAAELPKLLERE